MIRAFQWDLARQVERLDWLLAQLPRYAAWGYQELYLHLEDAVEFPSLPGVARPDAYSYRQMETLVAAATRVGIKVVPIVNLLGHTQYLIKVPDLRDLNELRAPDGAAQENGQICPLHPRTLEIAEKLLRDMAPFCTAGKLHTGLDESFHLGQHPLSRAGIAERGLAAHFAGHVVRMHQLVRGLGLRLGMWADMLYLIPEAIPLLPRDVIAYDWYYYPFRRHPRVELFNFAERDLAKPLQARGIEYWGCPMNGAFRYEPLPIFGERLENIRSWWARCHRVGAGGMLMTSWEAYRLAIEMTTVVDAAAASLWLDPEPGDNLTMLARGFERVFAEGRVVSSAPKGRRSIPMTSEQNSAQRTHAKNPAYRTWARAALASDAHAFAGYARWEINERWDVLAGRDGAASFQTELRFFRQLSERTDLPAPFAASVAFRRYLAERDVFVRQAVNGVWQLRRMLAKATGGSRRQLSKMAAEARAFATTLVAGRRAARAMWKRTRDARARGQNEAILTADGDRLRVWRSWLAQARRTPDIAWDRTPVCGAWQLQFVVRNFAPALQKIVVEQRRADGTWEPLHARFTIEFRANAARPRANIQREMTVPVDSPGAELRIGVRGLGQVEIGAVALTNGLIAKIPRGWTNSSKRRLGQPAPRRGFPEIAWEHNHGEIMLAFD